MSQSIGTSASRNEPNTGSAGAGSHSRTGGTTDVDWKENVLGNAREGRVQNVSWGAIFAGVVTFLAIVLLFSLLTAAAGLDGSGTGAAVVSIIGLLLAIFGAGGVAGAMAVRGGLVHGFLTWATSILATVLLFVLLTLGIGGAVGGVLGSVVSGLGAAAGPSITKVQPGDIPTPSAQQSQQVEQAQQQAQQTATKAAAATKTGATYGFLGLLLGGAVCLGRRSPRVALGKQPANRVPQGCLNASLVNLFEVGDRQRLRPHISRPPGLQGKLSRLLLHPEVLVFPDDDGQGCQMLSTLLLVTDSRT